MKVRVRFFARFRELLGPEITEDVTGGTTVTGLIRTVAKKNREGYDAIFDEKGGLHAFVIVMKNGKRIAHADAEETPVSDGDEIAIFPPVAGG